MSEERINHPSYYGGDTTYEVIKVVEAWKLGLHLGTAAIYLARAGKKPDADEIEDLEKCIWWINRRIKKLKERREKKQRK